MTTSKKINCEDDGRHLSPTGNKSLDCLCYYGILTLCRHVLGWVWVGGGYVRVKLCCIIHYTDPGVN